MSFLESLPNVEIVNETSQFSNVSSNEASMEIPSEFISGASNKIDTSEKVDNGFTGNVEIDHHHSFNVSVPLKVGCTAPMFVLSFFLHSILFAGSVLDSFQCLRSLLIVSFHVFFGLPRPRCPTTSNSVIAVNTTIIPYNMPKPTYQHSLAYNKTVRIYVLYICPRVMYERAHEVNIGKSSRNLPHADRILVITLKS